MKNIILLFVFIIRFQSIYCQENITQDTTQKIDSLLQMIDIEKDDNKRFPLLLNTYQYIIDTSPYLILEISQKLYKISKKNNDIISEACAWSFYGQGYRLSANYIKGLECQHKAVAMAEKIENKSVLAFVQNQMANIYKDREENEKALRLYLAAKENALKGNNKEALPWPLMQLGAIYLIINIPDSSLFYSQQAYNIFRQKNITVFTPYIFTNIAGAYSKMGNDIQATVYYRMAIKKAQDRHSARFTNLACLGLAEHYKRLKQQDSCVAYAKKAIVAVQNSVFSYLSMKPSKLLTDIYEESNADSTLKYLKIYRAANDSLFSTRANQQLQMLTFEEEQRQLQLATEKIRYQNKIRINLMLAGLAVFILIAFILYRNNLQKQKTNRLLLQQKEEVQRTLNQLKSTQSQLIQSEKMASLGELTAGIAHEIQNPLNFVNNFSEVNTELIEEMKQELEKGNMEEVKSIVEDIAGNEKKIVQHGKRADSIVKGMLLHSRKSSGIKEPTDINSLADEFLRLTYHGVKAKDKSFDVTIKNDFDPSIGKINIVAQEMGRVLMNLLNNAFYAVNEKRKLNIEGYEPTVTISTRKLEDRVEIKVSDNGNGIPQTLLDKVFQPFFTTKPSGEGTGLGLSLSYDIVTKGHDGELKIDTKEGEYTTFIIDLPV